MQYLARKFRLIKREYIIRDQSGTPTENEKYKNIRSNFNPIIEHIFSIILLSFKTDPIF